MDRVPGDEHLFDRLRHRSEPVEVVDAAGNVIGTFLPAGLEPTTEELDTIERNVRRTYTGDEVIAHLRSLA